MQVRRKKHSFFYFYFQRKKETFLSKRYLNSLKKKDNYITSLSWLKKKQKTRKKKSDVEVGQKQTAVPNLDRWHVTQRGVVSKEIRMCACRHNSAVVQIRTWFLKSANHLFHKLIIWICCSIMYPFIYYLFIFLLRITNSKFLLSCQHIPNFFKSKLADFR